MTPTSNNIDKPQAQPVPLEEILPDNMPRELGHNFARDVTWTTVSALNCNIPGRIMPSLDSSTSLSQQITSPSFVQPMAAQWLYASVPMLLYATGETIYRKVNGEEIDAAKAAKIWAPPIAASLAIPMWDLAQTIGTKVGSSTSSSLWYGSSIAAGMIAAPLTGVFEGFTQWSVKYLADVATNPVTREMWRQDPALMGKQLVKEFALNVTIGAIPGAIWQVVYFFALPFFLAAGLNPVGAILLTAVLVGIAVMSCNFACTHVINHVSKGIDEVFGWDIDMQKLRENAERALKTYETPPIDNKKLPEIPYN